MQHSNELDQLAAALAKAQAAVKGAKKDAANPFFKTTYADLASVWEACRDALTSNGLSVAQFPGFENGVVTLDTVLLHSSGQWISGIAGAPLSKHDAQGVGSALTYLRRYALAAVASVSPEDDDGNAASTTKAGRRGTATAPPKGAAAPANPEPAPTPKPERAKMSPPGVEEPPEGPTRDTPYPGVGAVQGKTVRQWAINQLRAVDAGTVKVADEWVALVRQELRARAAKAQIAAASGAA